MIFIGWVWLIGMDVDFVMIVLVDDVLVICFKFGVDDFCVVFMVIWLLVLVMWVFLLENGEVFGVIKWLNVVNYVIWWRDVDCFVLIEFMCCCCEIWDFGFVEVLMY